MQPIWVTEILGIFMTIQKLLYRIQLLRDIADPAVHVARGTVGIVVDVAAVAVVA